jgi:hypothetical protein
VAPPVANVVTAARAPPVRARLPVAVGLKHPTRFVSEHIREEVELKEEDQHVESDLEDVQNYEEEGIVIETKVSSHTLVPVMHVARGAEGSFLYSEYVFHTSYFQWNIYFYSTSAFKLNNPPKKTDEVPIVLSFL